MSKFKCKPGAILLGVVIGFTTLTASASELNAKQKKAPSFSYPSIENTKSYGTNDFKGKYLLIDFWASWCPPCNAAIPELKRLYSQYAGKGFEILGVSIDGSEQAWRNKVASKELGWANILTPDKGKTVASQYGFSSIPHFVLLDKNGNIVREGFSIQELPHILESTIK